MQPRAIGVNIGGSGLRVWQPSGTVSETIDTTIPNCAEDELLDLIKSHTAGVESGAPCGVALPCTFIGRGNARRIVQSPSKLARLGGRRISDLEARWSSALERHVA